MTRKLWSVVAMVGLAVGLIAVPGELSAQSQSAGGAIEGTVTDQSGAVLQPGSLSPAQRWGVAVASAIATRHAGLREALVADARAEVGDDVIEDARAAAVLMAMNNVYYRFRHMVGKPSYAEKPARLRMNRLVKPSGNKVDNS